MKFDEINGSWELIPTINQPIDYHAQALYQNTNGIYVLFGTHENRRIGLMEKENHGYFLDWKSMEWSQIEININGINNSLLTSKAKFNSLETKDYLFLVFNIDMENIGWNLIEKESGEIYFYDALKNMEVFESPFVEIIDNKIFYESPNGTLKSLNLDFLKTKSNKVGSVDLKTNKSFFKNYSYILNKFYNVGFALILFTSLIIYFKNKRKSITKYDSDDNPSEIIQIINAISEYSGQTLNSEQLDNVIGINTLENMDSKRVKRAKVINRVNEYFFLKNGKSLIQRDKDPSDKRYVYYTIEN